MDVKAGIQECAANGNYGVFDGSVWCVDSEICCHHQGSNLGDFKGFNFFDFGDSETPAPGRFGVIGIIIEKDVSE
jgi:hypothetical protein